jgi:hypothetical protein
MVDFAMKAAILVTCSTTWKTLVKKNEIAVRFGDLVDRANHINSKAKEKRFYAMSEGYNGKLADFGMYDYNTKKYVLSNVFATDAPDRLAEIERMLNK